MARDRQSAKQRQAERRARRLAGEDAPEGAGSADLAASPPDEDGRPDPHLEASAPPEEVGRSDAVLEDEPELYEEDEELAEEALEQELPEDQADAEEAYAPRGRRGRGETETASRRPRFVQFLVNCWAELKRVQWPKRPQLITLTWVVLGFVVLAGSYLGLLDAIFSRVVQAIL